MTKVVDEEKLDHKKLREIVVKSVTTNEDIKATLLPSEEIYDDVNVQGWMDNMVQNGHWCDHAFLQLAANYLKKNFIILPIYPDDGYGGTDRITIESTTGTIGEPFYFLNYSNVHFQSIFPRPVLQ